jgi:hypothetical protein
VKNQRTNAVIDRVALWLWIQPQTLDVDGFVDQIAHRKRGTELQVPTNGRAFPTWEDVIRVRSYEPKQKTVDAIKSLLRTLSVEAKTESFDINPRRVTHWYDILYRYTAWLVDAPDFDLVPAQAATILRYAYPALSMEDWRKWDQVARSVGDPLQAALDSATMQAHEAFKDVMRQNAKPSEMALKLGKALAQVQSTLTTLEDTHGKDTRIGEANIAISNTYSEILNGNDPFEIDMD